MISLIQDYKIQNTISFLNHLLFYGPYLITPIMKLRDKNQTAFQMYLNKTLCFTEFNLVSYFQIIKNN